MCVCVGGGGGGWGGGGGGTHKYSVISVIRILHVSQ